MMMMMMMMMMQFCCIFTLYKRKFFASSISHSLLSVICHCEAHRAHMEKDGAGGRGWGGGGKRNCVLVCQVALWCNGQHSGLSHQRPGFQFRRNRVKSNSAAATAAHSSGAV